MRIWRSRVIPAAHRRVQEGFDNRKHIGRLAAVFRRGVPALGAEGPLDSGYRPE